MKVPDPRAFRTGRQFAAWLGLTPKDHSTAGKYGSARSRAPAMRPDPAPGQGCHLGDPPGQQGAGQTLALAHSLLKRKPPKLAAVALANKIARIAWKLMVSGEPYNRNHGGGNGASPHNKFTGGALSPCR